MKGLNKPVSVLSCMIIGLLLIGISWSIHFNPPLINIILESAGFVLEIGAALYGLVQVVKDVIK
ncbi:hypothetical protein [Mucilaginibacter sp.]|uniref:hypothetical protein n=1 Tax=Mucilaginibacter sp. TaxID=1882438 RepID=UPI003D0ADA61